MFNKNLVIRFQDHIKNIFTVIKLASFQSTGMAYYTQTNKCCSTSGHKNRNHKNKNRNHTIISIDAETAFGKIKHSFIIRQARDARNTYQHNKGYK